MRKKAEDCLAHVQNSPKSKSLTMENTDILIVGGGLSGLALALRLEHAGVSYLLIEARDRMGGRIYSPRLDTASETGNFDMGPAWFWRGQPRIEAIVNTFGLKTFEQYANGDLMYQDAHGNVQRGRGFNSMAGSLRLEGGMGSLISAFVDLLPGEKLLLKNRLTKLHCSESKILAEVNGGAKKFKCKRVVLALPPRIAAAHIDYKPELSNAAASAMQKIPTWMAGHAKIMAVYDRPFWREAGLSGDVGSQSGPMMEIHDASPATGGPYALFGFIGEPALGRDEQVETLKQRALNQFGQIFGNQALAPSEIVLQDWAFETETSAPLDLQPLFHHPDYGLPLALSDLWEGRLLLGSTETARQFGGYLEGALEAADDIAQKLLTTDLTEDDETTDHAEIS